MGRAKGSKVVTDSNGNKTVVTPGEQASIMPAPNYESFVSMCQAFNGLGTRREALEREERNLDKQYKDLRARHFAATGRNSVVEEGKAPIALFPNRPEVMSYDGSNSQS